MISKRDSIKNYLEAIDSPDTERELLQSCGLSLRDVEIVLSRAEGKTLKEIGLATIRETNNKQRRAGKDSISGHRVRVICFMASKKLKNAGDVLDFFPRIKDFKKRHTWVPKW